MPRSTDLNAGDFLVSTGLSYPKLLFFRSAWHHAVDAVGGDSAVCYSNSYKRNNWLSEIFVSSQIQTLCTLFLPECFTYKQISFFFNEEFTSGRGRQWTLHFYAAFIIVLIYWFVWNFAVHNSDRKIGYYDFRHFFFFCGWVGRHLQWSTLLTTHPPSSKLGYLTTPPLQNLKKKKERRPKR